MDTKLFIDESKNQARKSGSRYSQDIRNNLPFIYIFIAQELTNMFAKHFIYHILLRLGHGQEMVFVNQGFIESFGILIWKTFF